AVGFATVSTAMSMDAVAIIIPTMTGETARLVSHFRPEVPIYAISPLETTVRKMQLYWGVYPLKGNEETSTVNMIENSMRLVRKRKLVRKGQLVVFTAGDPATNDVRGKAMTNMMHVVVAK
ncbi:MAG TPA: pyruvate kinase, partial [Candidatus Limivivens intestinipullorum]|nr:pyruvate kinase [Candidatus Limivivens intestinipullorum]